MILGRGWELDLEGYVRAAGVTGTQFGLQDHVVVSAILHRYYRRVF
jgi:hypothetical protein